MINAYGAPPHCTAAHPRHAYWREWAPDSGFGRRDPTVNTGNQKPLAKLRSANDHDPGSQDNKK